MKRNSSRMTFFQRAIGWCKIAKSFYELVAKFLAELIVGHGGTSRYRRNKVCKFKH